MIAGGRNEEMCKSNYTPFLNDIYLFLLDQKVWLKVKHSAFSEGDLSYTGNHAMAVVSDSESYEKILIFGGIVNDVSNAT